MQQWHKELYAIRSWEGNVEYSRSGRGDLTVGRGDTNYNMKMVTRASLIRI